MGVKLMGLLAGWIQTLGLFHGLCLPTTLAISLQPDWQHGIMLLTQIDLRAVVHTGKQHA